MQLPSLKKAEVKNKTVLVRADFDVPLEKIKHAKDSQEPPVYIVEDDSRLKKALPTIRYLLEHDAKVIAIGHLGRPKAPADEFSMLPVAQKLAAFLDYPCFVLNGESSPAQERPVSAVYFIKADFRQAGIKKALSELGAKNLVVLENLRFYPGEKQNDKKFSAELASLGDVYVDDSFGNIHRADASMVGLPELLPHYAGIELEKEVAMLSQIASKPRHPYVAMIGGVKLDDKLEGLKGLMEKADKMLVGGGLAALFYKGLGYDIGISKIDEECSKQAWEVYRNFKNKIILPIDVVVARSPENLDSIRVTTCEKIMPAEMVLDIGPATIRRFAHELKSAQTIVWSGPMGLFEIDQFSHGTKSLGRLIASRARGHAVGVAGGGNTLDAIKTLKMGQYFDFLSSGGSAMLLYLGGKELPGLEALKKGPKFTI